MEERALIELITNTDIKYQLHKNKTSVDVVLFEQKLEKYHVV